MIFIDELDSVGGKRIESPMHPYSRQTINQLLAEMDGYILKKSLVDFHHWFILNESMFDFIHFGMQQNKFTKKISKNCRGAFFFNTGNNWHIFLPPQV